MASARGVNRRSFRASRGVLSCRQDPDWLTLGAVVAVGGLLWRAPSTRIDDVGRRLDTLASDVKSLHRRVARLEGWLERDRLGTATRHAVMVMGSPAE